MNRTEKKRTTELKLDLLLVCVRCASSCCSSNSFFSIGIIITIMDCVFGCHFYRIRFIQIYLNLESYIFGAGALAAV